MDELFKIVTVSQTPNPQQVTWVAMHQCYTQQPAVDTPRPDETAAGEAIIKHLLAGGRGHWGPLEHPQITVNAVGFPHSVMQQVRTHRVGASFDVSSFRYNSESILRVGRDGHDPAGVFYLRPAGTYTDRQGKRYEYTEARRHDDFALCATAARAYARNIEHGMSEEHARSIIPFDVRQNFVMSANARSLMHILDLRWKRDAQLEAQQFAGLLFDAFRGWMPQIAEWYLDNRAHRAKLSP